MIDGREALYTDFRNVLIGASIQPETISSLLEEITMKMSQYEIMERSTELEVYQDTTEDVLKIFVGSILTEGKAVSTAKMYTSILRRFHRDFGKPLLEATTMDIRLWLASARQTVSQSTSESYRSYLSAFYIWAKEEGYIEINPMDRIKRIKVPKPVKTSFSSVDTERIRESIGKDQKRDRAIFEFLLASGLRANELCNVRIDDVDFSTRAVLVRKAKGGNQRMTYINEIALHYLKEYLNDRPQTSVWLFCNRTGEQLNVHGVEDTFRKIGKKSGVTNVHPHRCRRTFATELSRKGMPARNIQELMGHKDLNTTMRYISLSESWSKVEYEKYN